jgi:hypothetical protein
MMIKKLSACPSAQGPASILQAAMLVLTLAVAGCSAPAVEGFQIQAPPEGFLYTVIQSPGGGVLSPREVVSQGMWLGDIKLDEPLSTLQVTRYRGPATEAEVAAARDARVARVINPQYNVIGPLRARAVPDSGRAWSWTEERHDEYGRFRSMQLSEVVSFDTVSFSLVFDTEVPERMTEAHMEAVLATFALGRTVVHWRVIWAVAGTLVLLAGLLGRRARPRPRTEYRLWEKEESPKSPRPNSHDASGGPS